MGQLGRMYRRLLAVLLAAGSCAACAARGPAVPSLVQLLTDPGAFEGQEVVVHGYLASTTDSALFLTEEHARMFDHASSISVLDTTEDGYITQTCDGFHALVEGTLRKRSDAPLVVGPSGISRRYEITDVTRILIHRGERLETCWPRSQ